MDFSCSLQMRLISSSATIKQEGELLWMRPLLLLHLLPKFAMCAVPSRVSFGSRSFSWPISGSSRDSLEPWDITKHCMRSWRQRLVKTGWKAEPGNKGRTLTTSAFLCWILSVTVGFYGNRHVSRAPSSRSLQHFIWVILSLQPNTTITVDPGNYASILPL